MMITDPPNILEKFYHNHIESAKSEIEKNYECFDWESNTDKFPNISDNLILQGIRVDIKGRAVEIIVGFPSTFPDALPKLYLSKEDCEQYYPLPHLQSNGFICTRASDVIDINEKRAEEATLELIEIAIEDLRENIGKGFNEEFKKEFLAYWEEQVKWIVLFLAQPVNEVKVLALYSLNKKVYSTKYLISDSEEKVKKWTSNIGLEYSDKKNDVLYIPLNDIESIPQTNSDIKDVFSNLDNGVKERIEHFYNASLNNTIIIFSLKYNDILIAGFNHKNWNEETFKGFRANSVPWKLRLVRNGDKKVERIKVININSDRLLQRGGIDKLGSRMPESNLKIIGCGSVGSHLSMLMAKGGIRNLTLIDSDYLKPENIHRHLCGFDSLISNKAVPKTKAVKDQIQAHLPNSNIATFHEDILKLLMSRDDIFHEDDYIIVATADKSVERRINYLVHQLDLKINLIFLWLEPYGIGGHLVYINPDDEGCYQCCFNAADYFIYSFSKRGQSFNKREAGCQSSYVPYSNVELEQFVSLSSGVLFNLLNGSVENSTVYSWYLNPSTFKDEGYCVSDYWLTANPFTLEKNPIKANPTCEICGKE